MMTNNKKLISLIFFIFLILMAVTIWLVLYSLDNYRITPYPSGTEVGYVYIGGKNTGQAESVLRDKINEWKNANNLTIELCYQDSAFIIDVEPDKFHFDVEKSIQNVVESRQMNYEEGINVIEVTFTEGNENYIEDILSNQYDELKFSEFDTDMIQNEVLKYVSYLYKEIYIDLGIAVDENVAKTTPVGDPIEIVYDEADFLSNKINGIFNQEIRIEARQQFSLNEFLIEVYQQENNKISETSVDNIDEIDNMFFLNNELNIIATGIYQTIIDTNFKNINKHISQKLPSFVQAGLEANVEIDKNYIFKDEQQEIISDVSFTSIKDLSFYNPNNQAYFITISHDVNTSDQDVLVFQLYGTPFINTYTHDFFIKKEIPQGEIEWPSHTVNPDDRILHDPGYPGYRSIVYRKTEIAYPRDDGKTEINTILTEDFYIPKDAIYIIYDDTANI